MRLVVDTSIIISSLMRDSMARRIILHPDLSLITPEYVHVEIRKHFDKIKDYSGLTREELQTLLNSILANIEVIPKDEFVNDILISYEIMKEIDPEDTAFMALAIALDCDGIWSNDLDFERQEIVKIWKTHDLKEKLKIEE